VGQRRALLLAALIEAGDAGVSGRTLAQLVGPRFGEYVARLRRAGAEIQAASGTRAAEWRYRLAGPLPPALAADPSLPALSIGAKWSARAAYNFIRPRLQRPTLEGLAEVAELVRAQPELLASRYVRHNLAGKTRALDEIAAACGIAPPEDAEGGHG
jgi:hypothetical protein